MAGKSDRALIACLISLLFPGLGLLLSKKYVLKGILIFVLALILNGFLWGAGMIGGAICIAPFALWALPPIVHIGAAIYTYDMMTKEGKLGKPIYFK